MPAYMLPVGTAKCEHPGCTRKATHRVFNTWNALQGHLCSQHAHQLVKTLNAKA